MILGRSWRIHLAMLSAKPLLAVLDGARIDPPPIWLMRQAGRFLPEYRAVRAKVESVLDLAYAPRMAAEVTLQPVRRFGFDAAILFSDILVVPDALNCKVSFVEGEGPRLDADPRTRGSRATGRSDRPWTARPDLRDDHAGEAGIAGCLRDARLLRRPLDGRELYDRRSRHSRPRSVPAVRLPISSGVSASSSTGWSKRRSPISRPNSTRAWKRSRFSRASRARFRRRSFGIGRWRRCGASSKACAERRRTRK